MTRTFDRLQLLEHQLIVQTSDGRRDSFGLEPQSVGAFCKR
jgi:hypothetical protein